MTHARRWVLAAAVHAVVGVGCAVDAGGDLPIGDLIDGKADGATVAALSEESPRRAYRLACAVEQGCGVQVNMFASWLTTRPTEGALIDLASLVVTGPADEPLVDFVLRHPPDAEQGPNIETAVVELEIPRGESLFRFDLGPDVPAVDISLSVMAGPLATLERRDLCWDACELLDDQGCTSPELRDACFSGCERVIDDQADYFVTCVARAESCSTWCFGGLYPFPGIRQGGATCEPVDAADGPCTERESCTQDGICVSGRRGQD